MLSSDITVARARLQGLDHSAFISCDCPVIGKMVVLSCSSNEEHGCIRDENMSLWFGYKQPPSAKQPKARQPDLPPFHPVALC